MLQFMTKSSKLSKIIFSANTEELIKDIVLRAEKFRIEANSIISEYQLPQVIERPNQLIENIFLRFHSIVCELNKRYEKRPTFPINDEYDVQDLLRVLLKTIFNDVRTEEDTPSYAGGCGRIDILLKQEKIAIEVKMMRESLNDRTLGEQLLKAIARYKHHPDCEFLYCFVYDPKMMLGNATAIKQDLTREHDGLPVKVFVVPERI